MKSRRELEMNLLRQCVRFLFDKELEDIADAELEAATKWFDGKEVTGVTVFDFLKVVSDVTSRRTIASVTTLSSSNPDDQSTPR